MTKSRPVRGSTSKRTAATTIDEYLAMQTPEVRAALEKLRKTIRAAAPKATEGISYQIPSFKHRGPLVGFAAFKAHCSFFVMNTGLVEKHAAKLKGFELGKGTIQFTIDKPIPAAVVKTLVKARIAENEARS
jgi:uncharacterized protein YdhG (YjbR/CyaY superfamily)